MVRQVVVAALAWVVPAAAQTQGQASAASLPEGWMMRADRAGANMAALKFVTMGSGFHITAGPVAGVYYRSADNVPGKFHAVASFTQTKAPMHPEGYGLFLGGADLQGDGQKYTYFLVRGDGMYLVKQRNGAQTSNVVDWTASDAVTKADADGKATNKLEIDASGAKVKFLVNGKAVHEMDPGTGGTGGIVGLRANHGLDIHVEGFAVHKM